MFVISLSDFDKIAQQLEGRHHPHYQGTTKTEFNNLVFTFKPFTGTEKKPVLPAQAWHDESLTRAAREALAAEYEDAHRLWFDAQYIRELNVAGLGAAAVWTAYTQARQEMDQLFASLDSTAETRWRSTVFQLVTAQEKALTAAAAWDRTARAIVDVHASHNFSNLSQREAAAKAGLDTAWEFGARSDYDSWGRNPLNQDVFNAVERQREHLRQVASLTGDH
ncbi:hypothetical protein P3T36_006340 [Kitasatospora sp. MAP12-15]|uniref:hypothetical protein n=1 Tax=unclassified Kitasatospora TaxID=2633591 RepID=UPI002474E085|nr:hypothetical protein [Kitasatospora sp. MAP12-44]MDH6107881.1 hypothetical protein [Kitasatospora sp. MAP12-44]